MLSYSEEVVNFKVDLPLAAKYFRFSILDRVRAVGRSYLTRVFLCHRVLLRIHKHSRKWKKKTIQQQQWPNTKNSRTSVLYFLEGAENSRINNETKSNNNNNEKKIHEFAWLFHSCIFIPVFFRQSNSFLFWFLFHVFLMLLVFVVVVVIV